VPLLPVAFWLCGAEKIVTIDLNPYVRNELVRDMLFFIKMESDKIKNIFGDLLIMDRFNLLLDYCKKEKGTSKNSFFIQILDIFIKSMIC
jgi:hypothetical protein